MSVRRQLCVVLIDRFNRMLDQLVRLPEFAHVRYLDLRNTLTTGPRYKDAWANELHPTPTGFEAVTAKFAAIV